MKPKESHSTVLFFYSQQRDRGPAEQKLKGVLRFARACGWNIVIQEAPRSSNEVRDLIKAWHPLGCIVDMNESNRCFTEHSLGSTPTTFLDFDNLQSRGRSFRVNHNPDAVGALAARHLLSLNLTHFAFVGYTREWGWSEARRKSFLDHLGDSADSFQSFAFPITADIPADTRRQFLNWLEALPRPCGLLLAYDGLAREVYPACAKLKLKIPEDIAILGVDDNERFCGNLRPTLSSVLLDFTQAGWMVAELLHRVIRNPSLSPFVQTFNPLGIAPRGSTAIKVRSENPIAKKAKELIAQLATTGANAEAIARHFDCSRRLLELRFRESTGQTILESIHAARLEKACELLKDQTVAIGKIAPLCGFVSESALKAAFRRQFGMTMSKWRKSSLRR